VRHPPLLIVPRQFLFPQAATARVVAGVHQDAEGPGTRLRLPAKTGDAALHFEGKFLATRFASVALPRMLRASSSCATHAGNRGVVRAQSPDRQAAANAVVLLRSAAAPGRILFAKLPHPPSRGHGRGSSLPGQRKSP